ncbi:hypothetical protein ENKNEFLB_01982 [Nocardioides aquaticus]|uniref:Autophagy-related protein 2 n=1 Tax=Nocardioides aquaticus TaxID=160826 RepID=A0ABX8EGF3_9ACTN|nr:hypothetical protein [Nocardioides aquaticus]QVT79599.1 hypothetical protein ENKNEFLB_01982 [Nocardioides aquaticus]
MSNASDEDATAGPDIGISDDQLPEDLVPSEENPLAEGLTDGEQVDDLMSSGKPVERSEPDGPFGENDTSHDEGDDSTGS